MLRIPTITASLLLVLTTACSSADYEASGALGDDSQVTDPADTDSSATPPPDTGAFDAVAEFWSIDGSLALVGGEIDPAYSTFEVRLWGADASLLCTLDVPLIATAALAPPPTDPAMLGWWSLDYDEGASIAAPSCGTWDAGSLALGLGPYDSRLDPALDARDLLGADVYSLYLQTSPEDPVFVVGIAGTAALLAGTASTLTAPPLPDDQYALESLVLLNL